MSARRASPWAAHWASLLLGILLTLPTPTRATDSISAGIDLTDDRGQTIHFSRAPLRIVSLLPSLTEAVCEVGACTRLVGTDRYSNWPKSVDSLPKLGGIEDATVERIVALHPDVVLLAQSARAIDRLEELGIPVVALRTNTFADAHRVLNLIAQMVGTPDRGAAAWQNVEARIAAAAARVPEGWRGRRVFFEVSEAPHGASASSFIGELLARLGLANVVPASLGPFPMLSPEYVVRAQPDLVMASTSELAGMASRPGWATLIALKAGHTCGFPAAAYEILIRPGPRLGEAADQIVNCLSHLPGLEAK